MPRIAIGLFEDPTVAKNLVATLERTGVDRGSIRMIAEPIAMTDNEANPGMSLTHTEFELDLIRDLMKMGVQRREAQAYREGVRRGGVLVMARGPDELVDAAAEAMNRSGAAQVGELASRAGAQGAGSHAYRGTEDLPFAGETGQAGRIRYSGGGARVFVW